MSYIKQDEGGGDTYTLKAAQSGADVDIQLDAAAGTDSDVKLKAGTNITLTEASDTVTIDSAGAGGSIGVNQVAFGNPSSAGDITGSDNFTFVDESGGSGPTTLLKGDKPILQMEDDTGTTNFITELQQSGASMFVMARRTGAETDLKEMMRLQRTEIAINNDAENLNVRIEGESVDNLLTTDASQDNVGIGTSPDNGIERLHVKGTGLTDMVVFEGTSEGSGASDGPDLILYNSATPTAPNKFIGRLEFRGKNDAAATKAYGSIQTFIQDETASTEDSLMLFKTMTGGSALEKLRINLAGTELNSTGSASLNFDVKTSSSTQQSFFKTYNSATLADRYTEVLRGTLTVSATPRTITEDYCYGSNVYMTSSASVITLPEGQPGMHLQVVNGGLTGLTMNPASGEEINGSSSAYSLTDGFKITKVICVAAGEWVASD